MEKLSDTDIVHIAVVLDDCIDQLSVLGRIMPASLEDTAEGSKLIEDDILQILDGQKEMENKFQQVMDKKGDLKGQTKSMVERRQLNHRDARSAGMELSRNAFTMSRGLLNNPVTPGNLKKVQKDRSFVENVLFGTMHDLYRDGGYKTLVDAVEAEKIRKARLLETMQREEEGRKRIKQLQKQIMDVRREKEEAIIQRNEMIAHLKDQLQEIKAKTNMEGKYVKKVTDVSVQQTAKKCELSEKEMMDEINKLNNKIDQEMRVHEEIDSFLKDHIAKLKQQLEDWKKKAIKNVDEKQRELDLLKAAKAKDLEKLQNLTRLYIEYEQVVVSERILKEKARRKMEQEQDELRACIKVQAWWRGMMVRKGLGAFGKKKKKGKKGKGKGKKKKK